MENVLKFSRHCRYLRSGGGPLASTGPVGPWPLWRHRFVAHPPPPVFYQGRYYFHPYAGAEIASLVQMATAGGPAILMGDLNLTDQNDNYALLSEAGLTDAFRAVGWGFGFLGAGFFFSSSSIVHLTDLFVR